MKKKWMSRLRRAGAVLLLAAMVAEITSSYAYAGTSFIAAEEQQEAAKEEDGEQTKTIENTGDISEDENMETEKAPEPEESAKAKGEEL